MNEQLRILVKGLYPTSIKWRDRVNRMSDEQVFAIWQRHSKLKEEREKLDEEYKEFHDALRDEDSAKLDELFKQEALF